MQPPDCTDQEADALRKVLVAITELLDALATVRTSAERAKLGADFDATMIRLRDDIVHRMGCAVPTADACLVKILTQAADQVTRGSR